MNSPKDKTEEEFAEELGKEHGSDNAWQKHRQEVLEKYDLVEDE